MESLGFFIEPPSTPPPFSEFLIIYLPDVFVKYDTL